MNIFVLDTNPQKAAAYHCDKHVVKMIVESAQLLCSAHWATGTTAPYKKAHINHPCSIWVRTSRHNYLWLVELALSLCDEYEKRYCKIHKSKAIIEWCKENLPVLPKISRTNFALAMPEKYKSNDAVLSYRSYYIGEKSSFATWKIEKPYWYENK